jgi:hypothetical protein
VEPLFTRDDLENHIGKARLDLCLSDQPMGEASEESVAILIDNATRFCRGKIGAVFELSTLDADTAGDLKRLALDVARAYLAERAPESLRLDPAKIFDRVTKELKQLRIGESTLGTQAAPEPAANHGGEVTSGDPEDPCPKEHFALSGTGDY